MSPITVAAMIRNESERFLRSALDAWSNFASKIVVLDDYSDDDSHAVALAHPKVYRVEQSEHPSKAWGSESSPRRRLWDIAMEETPANGWIFILDADMVPARNPLELTTSTTDAWAFPLFDLWNAAPPEGFLYRDDGFWKAHVHPRIWMVRKPTQLPEGGWEWNERGIHCGHLPINIPLNRISIAPPEYGLLHYAYSTPQLRIAKYAQYENVSAMLTELESMHAQSILDPKPTLRPLRFEPELTLNRTAHAYANDKG